MGKARSRGDGGHAVVDGGSIHLGASGLPLNSSSTIIGACSGKSVFLEHECAALFRSITMSRYPFGFSKSAIYQEVLSVVASTVIVYLYNISKGNLPLDIMYRESYRFASIDSNPCATMVHSM